MCGSGAFPIGALVRIVGLLEKLGAVDPDNPDAIYAIYAIKKLRSKHFATHSSAEKFALREMDAAARTALKALLVRKAVNPNPEKVALYNKEIQRLETALARVASGVPRKKAAQTSLFGGDEPAAVADADPVAEARGKQAEPVAAPTKKVVSRRTKPVDDEFEGLD